MKKQEFTGLSVVGGPLLGIPPAEDMNAESVGLCVMTDDGKVVEGVKSISMKSHENDMMEVTIVLENVRMSVRRAEESIRMVRFAEEIAEVAKKLEEEYVREVPDIGVPGSVELTYAPYYDPYHDPP